MNITYASRYRPARYETSSTGRHDFSWEWKINGASVAEFEGAVDYKIRFGEEPSGYGIHFDPGSGDDIDLNAFWVYGSRKNPAWISGEENKGTSPYVSEPYPMPVDLLAKIKADKEFLTKLYQDISEAAQAQRSRIR